MSDPISLCRRLIVLCLIGLLSACASRPPAPDAVAEPAKPTPEAARIAELETQLAERQKHCAEEKRRLEAAQRETQKKLDETQQKLDALANLERSVRRRRTH